KLYQIEDTTGPAAGRRARCSRFGRCQRIAEWTSAVARAIVARCPGMRSRSNMRCVSRLALLALLLPGIAGCGARARKPFPGNLLQAASLRASPGVEDAARIHDGRTPVHGDPWLTNLSAVFTSADAHADFDLGRSTPIDAAFLEGDNNDWFFLAVSD